MIMFAMLLMSLIISSTPVHAADVFRNEVYAQHYDRSSGLACTRVTALAVDSVGDIWAGTHNGVFRYDGYTWRTISTPVDDVLSATRTEDYGPIFGTTQSAYSFTRHKNGEITPDAWTPFEHPYLKSPKDSLKRHVYGISEVKADHSVWFATETGAKHYTVFEWVTIDTSKGLPTDTVLSIASAGPDTTWIGTGRGLYLAFGKKAFQPRGLPQALRTAAVTALAWNPRASTLWAAAGSMLFRWNGKTWSPQATGLRERTNSGNRINTIFVAHDGTVFIGSDGGLTAIHFLAGSRSGVSRAWRTTCSVHAITQDRTGRIWIGTDGDGVYRWQPPLPEHNGTSIGTITAMVETPSGIIVSADSNLWRIGQSGAFTKIITSHQWSRCLLFDVDSSGDVWAGTDNGLYRIRGKRIVLALDSTSLLKGSPVKSIAYIEGRIWVGTNLGIWQIDPETDHVTTWSRTTADTCDTVTTNLLFPIAATAEGTIWMGTAHGVVGFQGENIEQIASVSRLDALSGKPHTTPLGSVVCGVAGADSTLWFHDDEHHVVQLVPSGRSHERWSSRVYQIDGTLRSMVDDHHGSVWVATSAGLYRFRHGLVTRYDRNHGLRTSNVYAIAAAPSGRMVAGTDAGIEAFTPDSEPPETRIVEIPTSVTPAGSLAVYVSGLDRWNVTPATSIRYRWQLDDGVWSEAQHSRWVHLSHVASGTHTFKVAAIDGDLNIDPNPAVASFTVEPPIWRRWYVLASFLVLFVTIALLARRVRTLEEQIAHHEESHHHDNRE